MIYNFNELEKHVGHWIIITKDGEDDVSIKCETCKEVIIGLGAGDLLKEELAEDKGKTIYHSWHIDDVISQAQSRDINLSEQQAKEILQRVDHHKDAMVGISWDTLDVHTDDYLKDMSG